MKVAILAASGKAGISLVQEALKREMQVSAFVRNKEKIHFDKKVMVIQKDIFDLKTSDLKEFDVIIDAFGEWENLSLHKKHLEYLANILQGQKSKLLIVGGAGSLYMDKKHTMMLMDTPEFPKEYLPIANAMKEGLEFLRTQKSINWIYVSPAAIFLPEAPQTNKYKIIGEEFEVNANNESQVSYKDYASALFDIAQSPNYSQQRIGVIGI